MTSAVSPEATPLPGSAAEEASNGKAAIQNGNAATSSGTHEIEQGSDADAGAGVLGKIISSALDSEEKSPGSKKKKMNGNEENKVSDSDIKPPSDGGNDKEPGGKKNGSEKISNGSSKDASASRSKSNGNAKTPSSQIKQPATVQTITITAQDAASSIVSVVDPWVPRIRNNDEYLQRGLDFSPRAVKSSSVLNDESITSTIINEGSDGDGNNTSSSNNNSSKSIQNGSQESSLVGDIGAIRLSEALAHNSHLLYLNLSRNGIGIEGGMSLAKCLYSQITSKSKTVLRVINLCHNQISNEGAVAFGLALRYNASLKELKLSDNGITSEGLLAVLEGMQFNTRMKRLSLVDNVKNLANEEMTKIVEQVANALRRGRNGESALEVMEMHNAPLDRKGAANDNFDGASEDDVWAIMCSLYIEVGEEVKLKNHRLRVLTLPGTSSSSEFRDDGQAGSKKPVHRLRRILGFNAFYRPILQLYDIINSPLAQAEGVLGVPIKLPQHLKRDVHHGALIALLPSSKSKSSRASSSSGGMECKLMPGVLSFMCGECTLDTIWNTIRYRPDIFCFAGASSMAVAVECAPCGSVGDGCCIS